MVAVYQVTHDIWVDDYVGGDADIFCSKYGLRHIAHHKGDIIFGDYDRFLQVQQNILPLTNLTGAISLYHMKDCYLNPFNSASPNMSLHDAVLAYGHHSHVKFQDVNMIEVIDGSAPLMHYMERSIK